MCEGTDLQVYDEFCCDPVVALRIGERIGLLTMYIARTMTLCVRPNRS